MCTVDTSYKEKLLSEIKTKASFTKDRHGVANLLSTVSDKSKADLVFDARMRFGDVSSAVLTYVADIEMTISKNVEDKWRATIEDHQLEKSFDNETLARTAAEVLFVTALIAHGCIRALVCTDFTASSQEYLFHVFAWQPPATTAIVVLEKQIASLEQRLQALEMKDR